MILYEGKPVPARRESGFVTKIVESPILIGRDGPQNNLLSDIGDILSWKNDKRKFLGKD
jgi:hypothetical protein